MRKFTSIFFALVLCISAMVVIASAADTTCPDHDWSAWETVEILDDGTRVQERHCACGKSDSRDIPPEHKHDIAHVEAVVPGCETEGNIEYWYCKDESCAMVWQDEALTQLTTIKRVILPATHQNVIHFDAVAPACHYIGNVEYWACVDCDKVWTDEGQTQLVNHKSVILPELGGEVAHVAAVVPGCETEGNIEYWHCATCEQVWQDEALTQLTTIKRVILPATHQNVIHFDAVAPACHYIGNVEYWTCVDCDKVWTDEGQTQLVNHKSVILPELGGEVAHVAAVVPGCETEGNIEYWHCATCEQVWQDEALTQLTNIKNVVLPATHQNVEHVAAVVPGCENEGNIEYWYCKDCVTVWQDEAQMQLTNIKNVVLPATHQNVEHVAAVVPGCENEGNIEYWYCKDCVTVWQDEAQMQLTNMMNVKLPITHNVEHVEAKAPTATENGNIEYWYCKDCGDAWLDELCTKNTNLKAVILPATGETPVDPGQNPETGDNAIFFVVALVAVATVATAVISFKKREN